MSKIIVGVDGSDHSKDAVALAARLAQGTDAELVLACAFPYDESPSRAANTGYRDYLRDDALATLEQAAEPLGDGVAYRPMAIAEVSPAKGLQELATRESASLIVIGSSHRGAVGRVLAGTTAERLLHGAPCPVAVAPLGYRERPDAGIATIAVGYDGSSESESALSTAVALARSLGARLRVIEVLDVMLLGTPALTSGPGYITKPEVLAERANEHLSEKVATALGDVPGESRVLTGSPEAELARESQDADLFIVGSRGYGPHRAVLLGSVSGCLVRDSGCPVIVVPRGHGEPLAELFPAASESQAEGADAAV